MSRDYDKKSETRRPMGFDEKKFMLAHLLRVPNLFREARSLLKPEYFDPVDDSHFALIWQAALKVSENNNESLPVEGARIRLEAEVSGVLESSIDSMLTAEQEEWIFEENNGFFAWAYALPDSWFSEADGRTCLTMFLEERTVVAPLKRFAAELQTGIPSNIDAIFKQFQDQQQKIHSVSVDPVESAFPDDWIPKKINKKPTNISFLDIAMGGGQAECEVYTIVGPTSGGKTLLGVQIAVQGALYEQFLHPDPEDADIGHWFFFTYECAVNPEIRSRVWSHACSIHRTSLEDIDSFSSLSTSDNLKPYELVKYHKEIEAGVKVLGEYERLMAMKPKLQRNLKLVDMSGSNPENPKVGCGGVEEIARIIQRCRSSGIHVAGFIVDYAGIAVDRYMAERNIPDDRKRFHLARFVDQCRRLIAAPNRASGWVLHQLKGEANSRAATVKQHHADTAECKTFSDNAWFAFNLGTKDVSTSTCRITCTKTRRSAGDDKERIVFIDGAFSTMTAGDAKYAIDAKNRKIILKDMNDKIMRGSVMPPSQPKRPNPGDAL